MNEKPCILYIDDDIENLIGFEASLNYNFNIFTTNQISEVDNILHKHPIEVIILDYKMPEKNGIELADHLFQNHQDIIYIITSAYADIDVVLEATNHHEIYGFIPKPWNLHELNILIKNATHFHATKQENKKLIKELKKNNELLEKAVLNEKNANELKNIFLKNISHEIRTPLNAIFGFNQIAISTSKDENTIKMLKHSINGCYDLLGLMNKIISASKILTNQVTYYNRKVSILDIVENAISSQLISRNKLKVETHIRKNLCINSDPSAVLESISSIVDNAAKFVEGGALNIFVEEEKSSVKIHFKDNGPGIKKEALDHIFEPFRQADETDSRKYGGIGLGLFIASQHMKNLNGSLKVKNTKEGADFIITLPL